MIKILQTFLNNGFIFFIPILIWNILLTPRLPRPYSSGQFDQNISPFILGGEMVFRGIVFILPLFLKSGVSRPAGQIGLYLYTVGILVYFGSWLLLILSPHSAWSRSLAGISAPAWTPLIWLTGISLMLESWYFPLDYRPWQYLVPAGLFLIFHFCHTAIAYLKNG